jgi:hypothetical protein
VGTARLITMSGLRVINYTREEFHGEDEPCEGTLLTFVYDIPYFSACGVFPPLHIVNEVFSSGGGGGGMSPGASWEPFTVSEEEYNALVEAVGNTPVSELRPYARYADLQMKFDHEFDSIRDRMEWVKAACDKHRDEWHAELERLKA